MPELLVHHLEVWRDSFRSALFWVISRGQRTPIEGYDEDHDLWFGYRSDLRHAGILDPFDAITLSPSVLKSFQEGIALAKCERGYAEPTIRQQRKKKPA